MTCIDAALRMTRAARARSSDGQEPDSSTDWLDMTPAIESTPALFETLSTEDQNAARHAANRARPKSQLPAHTNTVLPSEASTVASESLPVAPPSSQAAQRAAEQRKVQSEVDALLARPPLARLPLTTKLEPKRSVWSSMDGAALADKHGSNTATPPRGRLPRLFESVSRRLGFATDNR